AGQTETKPARRRVALLEGLAKVGDSRALVPRDDDEPRPGSVDDVGDDDLAHSRVLEDVPGELGDRGGDQGEVAGRETESAGENTPLLTRDDDVAVSPDGHLEAVRHACDLASWYDRMSLRLVLTHFAKIRQALLQIQGRGDTLEVEAQLHHGKSHLRLNADDHGLGAAQPDHVRGVPEHAGRERVHDVDGRDVHDDAPGPPLHDLLHDRLSHLPEIGVAERG